MNILIPSMPGLAGQFGMDYAMVQLTLTLYLVGMAIAQLGLGPCSDRFGRRPVMLAGFALFVGATILCAIAWSFEVLIAGRILQAIGACTGQVLGRAIVRDVHDRDHGASAIAFITMAMATAPAFAPMIGAYVDAWLGWRANFVGLALIGILTGVTIYLCLGETIHLRVERLAIRGAFRNYRTLANSRAFLGYTFCAGATLSVYLGFMAGGG